MKRTMQLLMLAGGAALVYGVWQLSEPWGWIVGGFLLYVYAYHLYNGAKSREPEAHMREADKFIRETAKRRP